MYVWELKISMERRKEWRYRRRGGERRKRKKEEREEDIAIMFTIENLCTTMT